MADKDTPNRTPNEDKAEGERWKSEEGVIPNSEDVVNRDRHGRDTPRQYEDPTSESGSVVRYPGSE